MNEIRTPEGVELLGRLEDRFEEVLSFEALDFLAGLHRVFNTTRLNLLANRAARQKRINDGARIEFLDPTSEARLGDWQVAPPAPGLTDRRVEITGPTEAKMTINALNSGAKVWLADFEDANTPLWHNMVQGQLNLQDALDGVLSFASPEGRQYTLRPPAELATIVARPRGLHLPEKHVLIDGEPMSGSLFDFGLYLFHCAKRTIRAGAGPYFYLPKMESHLEARLWNDVFVHAEAALDLPRGTIRATVLIETVPAAFEMEEILYELREHSAGLNAGRWDYLFSMIKVFRSRTDEFLLPDRNQVTMTAPMMRAYTELLVTTCHRRGAHAIGGMAAFIPSRRDPEVNATAMARVRADKEREANDGFDGSWVAHPDLVPLCAEVFTAVLADQPDQRNRRQERISVEATELLDTRSTPGDITEAGLRNNCSVALQYLASWLRGNGAVAIFNLMEDAATAEICRSQIWQWLHSRVKLSDGSIVTRELVERIVEEELARLGGPAGYEAARQAFEAVAISDDFADFLTLPAYAQMP
jgi:malate synthase